MNQSVIDVNVTLSRWPFRRLPLDEPAKLVARLREHHVRQAWAGSFDALLHKDIAAVNARLAHDCHEFGHGILTPFGAINPTLPNWEEDLRRCHEEHKMPGIRLHPNYHGYKLDDPLFAKVLHAATERNLIVQLAVIMEDKRTQHPLFQIPAVDLVPLPSVVKPIENLRLVLLNCFQPFTLATILKLVATEKIHFDIATLEGVAGIENLLKNISPKFLLFGSHAPFFYFESVMLKLKESAVDEHQLKSISSDNAQSLLK